MAPSVQKIGLLTGGGDCPGLNAVIRAAVISLAQEGCASIGLRLGWKGLLESLTVPLSPADVEPMLTVGGTMLGSSRTNPRKIEAGVERCVVNFKKLGLDGLIAIGGEDTLGFAAHLHEQGVPVVGVPKTIDNDLMGTDITFGFDTAVSIATDAIDRLYTTAKSHERTMVLEVMGRHAGWIATASGIAGGADLVLTAEFPMDLDAICRVLEKKHQRGKRHHVIVIAEGAELEGIGSNVKNESTDAFGHKQLGGIGDKLAAALKERMNLDTRSTTLGHIQRGGSPTASDRVLSTAYGLFAADQVLKGNFGKMVALQGLRLKAIPLKTAQEGIKQVPEAFFKLARRFFC